MTRDRRLTAATAIAAIAAIGPVDARADAEVDEGEVIVVEETWPGVDLIDPTETPRAVTVVEPALQAGDGVLGDALGGVPGVAVQRTEPGQGSPIVRGLMRWRPARRLPRAGDDLSVPLVRPASANAAGAAGVVRKGTREPEVADQLASERRRLWRSATSGAELAGARCAGRGDRRRATLPRCARRSIDHHEATLPQPADRDGRETLILGTGCGASSGLPDRGRA